MLLNKILNSPIPPFIKGGEGGLFTKKRLGGIAGLTLVEVLIAMVILLLVSLALMQTALVSIDANMKNVLRDESVSIAEMRMNEARNTSFDNLTAGTTSGTVPRNFRNITGFSYTATRAVIDLNSDNKRVDITVSWTWKGEPYTHSISSIVGRTGE